jgi:hypothetical protein
LRALSSGIKRLKREANHHPHSNAKIKNEWKYNSSTPHAFVAYTRAIFFTFSFSLLFLRNWEGGTERRVTVMFLTTAGGGSRFIALIRDEIKTGSAEYSAYSESCKSGENSRMILVCRWLDEFEGKYRPNTGA